MPIPNDKKLYERIANRIKRTQKHSAYRSGRIVKEYKEAYAKKYGKSASPYKEDGKSKDLKRWFKEDWKNQKGKVGYQAKGDVYRPTRKVSSSTPARFSDLSKREIKEAMKEKKTKGKVKKFDKYP